MCFVFILFVYLYCVNDDTIKKRKMNKEKVLGVVNDVIFDRITQLIEEMSTNEFVEMITDMVQDQTGVEIETDEEREEITDIIGSRVFPLLHKMNEYILGKTIPME